MRRCADRRIFVPSVPTMVLPPRRVWSCGGFHVAPLVADLVGWILSERARLSRHNDVAKAMDYMLSVGPFNPLPRDAHLLDQQCRRTSVAMCRGRRRTGLLWLRSRRGAGGGYLHLIATAAHRYLTRFRLGRWVSARCLSRAMRPRRGRHPACRIPCTGAANAPDRPGNPAQLLGPIQGRAFSGAYTCGT